MSEQLGSEPSDCLPRADCPSCGRNVALRRRGQLREHRNAAKGGELCVASGYTVAEVNEKIALEIAALRGIGSRS